MLILFIEIFIYCYIMRRVDAYAHSANCGQSILYNIFDEIIDVIVVFYIYSDLLSEIEYS